MPKIIMFASLNYKFFIALLIFQPHPLFIITLMYIYYAFFLGEPTCLLLLDATKSKSRHTLNVNTINKDSKHHLQRCKTLTPLSAMDNTIP